ncbi:hypothetical protein Lal_00041512, partial [Lupinus albus]
MDGFNLDGLWMVDNFATPNGVLITWPTFFYWNEMCIELMGKLPIDEQNMRWCELKLIWLVDNFAQLSARPTQLQLQQYCMTHILYGDVSGNKIECEEHGWMFTTFTILSMVSPTFSCTQSRSPTDLSICFK